LAKHNEKLKEIVSSQKSGGDPLADPAHNFHDAGLSTSLPGSFEMIGGERGSNANRQYQYIGGLGNIQHALDGRPPESVLTWRLPDGRVMGLAHFKNPDVETRVSQQELHRQATSLWATLMGQSQGSGTMREGSNSEVGDSPNLLTERNVLQEEQHDKDNSKFLVSEDKTERDLASEMIETRAYLDLWAKYGLEQPNTDELKNNHDVARTLLKTPIGDIEPQGREDVLGEMRGLNQRLQKAVEEGSGLDLNEENKAKNYIIL
jgi:hypothetical protein